MGTLEKTQRKRFEEVACELECDEDEKRFDATFKKVAKAGGEKEPDKKD